MREVRRVGPGDWALVRELRLTALEDAPDFFWATYEDEVTKDERWWRDFVAFGTWFVAHEDEGPAGLAAAIPDDESGDGVDKSSQRVWGLISMWVAPAARGKGVGRALVDEVIAWARAEQMRALTLWVTEGNDGARRLYERCGFTPTGRTQPLPRRQSLIEHEMSLVLAPI